MMQFIVISFIALWIIYAAYAVINNKRKGVSSCSGCSCKSCSSCGNKLES